MRPKDGSVYRRSAIISIGNINKKKKMKLAQIYNKGLELTKKYIDIVWKTNIGSYSGKEIYNKVQDNICTAKFRQLCCNNAISIVTSLHNKQAARLEVYNQLLMENKLENAARLNNKIIQVWQNKPIINNFSLDLSGNCVEIHLKSKNTKTKHQNWIRIKETFLKESLSIPFIKTKIFNKYAQIGKLSQFLQITQNNIAKVVFKIPKPNQRETGDIIGCDIGINHTYALAPLNKFGAKLSPDLYHGNSRQNLVNIYQKICKTKDNSIRCYNGRNQAKNYINWSINQINWSNIKTLHIEDLKNVKFKRKVGRFLHCWRYPLIIQKLSSKCEELGIKLIKVSPNYTSMRCSHCGWVKRENRAKELFKCHKCHFAQNADINAARNISQLTETEKINGDCDIGFYYKRSF
jgi:IS605 OrfB family transposase